MLDHSSEVGVVAAVAGGRRWRGNQDCYQGLVGPQDVVGDLGEKSKSRGPSGSGRDLLADGKGGLGKRRTTGGDCHQTKSGAVQQLRDGIDGCGTFGFDPADRRLWHSRVRG